ncbi:MAG: hypothetical protein KKD25_03715 [Gammaproteobacteria bacterium]|jgi:hypothetical protein|uniref:Uncharacterized protein n=1 Tax=viral metagenome TaxID=1070528 RepID=A0A6M3MAJ6_9ZZZZ|nr:hypothetical protein [Gammaproteobacteria bacterium]MBU0770966.1 hypothetical protein [Gammaproteobacteria bacterium]MBU0856718.1 hypothetical protein [Gammaproteobacteria bacterium]MBU1848069.1 hypothetical protein [Gammaproteobacteria bacterium]
METKKYHVRVRNKMIVFTIATEGGAFRGAVMRVSEYSPPWGVHGWDTGDGSELAARWFDTLEKAQSYLRDHLRRSELKERYVVFRLCHFSDVVEEYQTELEWVPRFLSVRTK